MSATSAAVFFLLGVVSTTRPLVPVVPVNVPLVGPLKVAVRLTPATGMSKASVMRMVSRPE